MSKSNLFDAGRVVMIYIFITLVALIIWGDALHTATDWAMFLSVPPALYLMYRMMYRVMGLFI